MEERFSTYLTEIGLLNETNSSSIIKRDEKSSNKSFVDNSFECLKNFFDNLDEEQKNYMSQFIPSKYIIISERIKKARLKSIIIQLIIRRRIILLKYFFIWKYKIEILDKFPIQNNMINKNEENEKENSEANSGENIFNNIADKYLDNKKSEEEKENNEINIEEFKDNVSSSNLVNIDKNIDIDNKNNTKSEEGEKLKINKSNHNNSISFDEFISKHKNEKNNKKKIKSKNIKNKNKLNSANKKCYYMPNKKINQIKKEMNLTSYKTINTNNLSKVFNNQYNTKNKSIIRNNSTKSNLHTSLEEKEIKELKECTFKPKINSNPKRTKSQNDINSSLTNNNFNNSIISKKKREEEIQQRFIKLYNDNEKYRISKEMKAIEVEHMMSKSNPFIPNSKKRLKNSVNKTRQKSEGNFEERQKEYLEKKNRHSTEIKKRINSDFEELCSFNPKITNDKGEYYKITKKEKINKKPVFIRLYQDSKERKNFQIKRETERLNKIVDLSNILNPQKNFNFNTINRLHENREKYDEINKTKKKVEEDEGITFQPYISENSYSKWVNGTFYERGQKLLNDRESFYEEENKKLSDGFRKGAEPKEYTKEERKQIINNIINRLYNDSVKNIKKTNKKEKVINFKSFYEQ